MRSIKKLKLISIVGPICSGKSIFLKIAESKKFIAIDWGNIFSDFVENNYERERYLESVILLINKRGRRYFIKKLIEKIEKKSKKIEYPAGIVIAGARHPSDLSYLLGYFTISRVVYINSDVSKRFERCKNRGRRGDPVTMSEFIHSDMKEYITGLAEIVYDFVQDYIDNNESELEFNNKVNHYLSKLVKEDIS